MRRLIARWLGVDERVRCEIRNTDRMADTNKRLMKALDYWREQYRAMRRQRDRLRDELAEARAQNERQREVTPR